MYKFCFKIEIKTKADLYMPCKATLHQVITGMMIDIVIRTNYKVRCLFPNIPRAIADSSMKDHAGFINADIVWSQI